MTLSSSSGGLVVFFVLLLPGTVSYNMVCITCNVVLSFKCLLQTAQRHVRHQKPLSRTQSAPLPVMNSVAGTLLLPPQQQALLEQQELVKQHQDQLSKQHQKKQVLGVSS